MAISSTPATISYVLNGVGPYTIPFKFLESGHIAIYIDGELSTVGFTVTGEGQDEGGSLTLSTVPTGDELTILRQVPLDQVFAYREGDSLPAKNIEDNQDRTVMQIQQLSEVQDRTLKFGVGSEAPSNITLTPNTTLVIDEDGNPINETTSETIARLGGLPQLSSSLSEILRNEIKAELQTFSASTITANLSSLDTSPYVDGSILLLADGSYYQYKPNATSGDISAQGGGFWVEVIDFVEPPEENSSFFNIAVIAQSGLASGREGGDISTNDNVFVWNYLADNGDGATEVWDKSLNPKQASPTTPVSSSEADWLIAPLANRQEDHNTWSHGFAKNIQGFINKPIRVIQSAESGRGILNWEAPDGILWDLLVDQTTRAGVTKYDCLLFDHGEASSSYSNHRDGVFVVYRQLLDNGYIDPWTPVIFREIRPDVDNQDEEGRANREIFELNHLNGFEVESAGLSYDVVNEGVNSIHITGESHDIVARRASDWFISTGYNNSGGGVLGGSLSQRLPLSDSIVRLGDLRILSSDLAKQITGNLPPTRATTVYASDYNAETETFLDSGESNNNLTLLSGSTDNVFSLSSSVYFDGATARFSCGQVLLPATDDFIVALRFAKITEAVKTPILNQYSSSDSGRTHIELTAAFKGRVFFAGNSLEATTPLLTNGEDNYLIFKREGDTFTLNVNGEVLSNDFVGVSIEQRNTELGASDISGSSTTNVNLKRLSILTNPSVVEIGQIEAWVK